MTTTLPPHTLSALKWIVNILDKNKIPYRIGGGFAARIYGSGRAVNDIDISIDGQYFPIIVAETKEYIVEGPQHYLNEKWDCVTLSLNYKGQEIDLTDVNTLRMTNRDMTEWLWPKDHYRKYPSRKVVIDGIEVSLFDPRDLVAYKKELICDEYPYQATDVEAVERYMEKCA